ncbi:YqgQ family protein [Bacillus sp. JCM 19041]|uniref:YqgQ family protein n=1 Tax=Bacillus sp. JCM 19041 TaxID=1460637 RepID=UPI0006D1BD04
MKTLFDIQQLLKRYGAFIYTRDRATDLQLMQGEIKELHQYGMIGREEYLQALLIIRQELEKSS